jgi:hypothetical protein
MRRDVPLLAYFGHHKAASRWFRFIVGDACEQLGLRWAYVHNPRQFEEGLQRFVEEKQVDFLIHANANLEHLKDLAGRLRGFHVIRDPRDVAVSAYFSHLHSHATDDFPRLVEHREKLRRATKDEGLLLEFDFRREQYRAMAAWNYSMPNVLELKMEDAVRDPNESFLSIFAFLGLLQGHPDSSPDEQVNGLPRLTPSQVAEVVDRNGFAKKSGGRKPGEEDVHSHYRKGVPGDWRNHFTERHKEYFKRNFNDLLVQLGYEKDNNW